MHCHRLQPVWLIRPSFNPCWYLFWYCASRLQWTDCRIHLVPVVHGCGACAVHTYGAILEWSHLGLVSTWTGVICGWGYSVCGHRLGCRLQPDASQFIPVPELAVMPAPYPTQYPMYAVQPPAQFQHPAPFQQPAPQTVYIQDPGLVQGVSAPAAPSPGQHGLRSVRNGQVFIRVNEARSGFKKTKKRDKGWVKVCELGHRGLCAVFGCRLESVLAQDPPPQSSLYCLETQRSAEQNLSL